MAEDRIVLDNAVFTGLADGALAAGAFHTGPWVGTGCRRPHHLQQFDRLAAFDADGAGGNAMIQFATLSSGPPLTAAEFLVV